MRKFTKNRVIAAFTACIMAILCFQISSFAQVTEHEQKLIGGLKSTNGIVNITDDGVCLAGSRPTAAFDYEIDGTKSFKYEAVFQFTGHGAGITFKTVDHNNFYAVEVNQEQSLYGVRREESVGVAWENWQIGFTNLTEKGITDVKDRPVKITYEYDANSKSAKAYVDGTLIASAEDFDAALLAGHIGVFSEDASVTFSSIEITVDGNKTNILENLPKYVRTNDHAVWENTDEGFVCSGGSRPVVKFGASIDGTESFRYEVDYTFSGYGAGITFKTVDHDNFYGVEINQDGAIYSLKRTPDWSIWQLEHTSIGEAADLYKVVYSYDAQTKTAVISLNGNVYKTVEGYDASEISGDIGFFTEDASAVIKRAVLVTYETVPDQSTPTPVPEATPTTEPNATADVNATPTQTPADTGESMSNSAYVIIFAAIVLLAAALMGIYGKKHKREE